MSMIFIQIFIWTVALTASSLVMFLFKSFSCLIIVLSFHNFLRMYTKYFLIIIISCTINKIVIIATFKTIIISSNINSFYFKIFEIIIINNWINKISSSYLYSLRSVTFSKYDPSCILHDYFHLYRFYFQYNIQHNLNNLC